MPTAIGSLAAQPEFAVRGEGIEERLNRLGLAGSSKSGLAALALTDPD